MPIKSFTVGFSRTKNLGNYESMRVDAQVVMELPAYPESKDSNADYIAAKEFAQRELRALIEQTYKAQFQEHQK